LDDKKSGTRIGGKFQSLTLVRSLVYLIRRKIIWDVSVVSNPTATGLYCGVVDIKIEFGWLVGRGVETNKEEKKGKQQLES
jgi:hypothetical protein